VRQRAAGEHRLAEIRGRKKDDPGHGVRG
jgi:hypothetical protein